MAAAASAAQTNGKTPIHSFFSMYFNGLEAFGQAYDPYLKAFARAQLEVAGLMSRRAQAYMEIPARLSRCRSPQEVAEEQMQFWRSAFEDYSASTTRITHGLASIAVPSFGLAAPDEMDSARDYITFPEPEEAARPGRPRDRRAA